MRRWLSGAGEHPFVVFIVSFLVLFAAVLTWSLATPLMASPDEPTQVAKAAAVVRGEWVGHLVGGPSSAYGIVRVPSAYSNLGYLVTCYAFKPNVPASCAPKFRGGSAEVETVIYDARYQPLYYLLVGWPSLLTYSKAGIYLMRIVGAALDALFLALAVMSVVVWSRSRLLLGGVVVAVSPSVLFFSGVVNPSGLEISAAVCLWTSALILARERLGDPPAGLLAVVALSAGVESLSRSMSPLFVALSLVAALGVAEWGELGRFLRRARSWLAIAFTCACGAFGTAWIVTEHSLNVVPPMAPIAGNIRGMQLLALGFDRTALYYTEMVSRFGWLAAPSPEATYLVWTALVGALLVLAFASASLRRLLVLVALLCAVVLIPLFVSIGQAHRIGITWQGRDSLPLAVGVPILCASLLAGSGLEALSGLRSRLVGVLAVSAGVASVVALFGDVRRNAVGDNGPNFAFLHARWQPPLGITGTLLLGVFATAAVVVVFSALGMGMQRPVPTAPGGEAEPVGVSGKDGVDTASSVEDGSFAVTSRNGGDDG